MPEYVLALTGASGAIYGVRLLHVLLASGHTVHVTLSPAAVQVLDQELGLKVDLERFETRQLIPPDAPLAQDSKLNLLRGGGGSSIFSEGESRSGKLVYHHFQDYTAGIASGSFPTGGMVICPCSLGTLGALAAGLSNNLIHRAAGVHLKERRKLIVVPRETPLSTIALDNMRTLCAAGAVVLPAMPGFYHGPLTIHDLVDFVVARICDQLQMPIDLVPRWGAS